MTMSTIDLRAAAGGPYLIIGLPDGMTARGRIIYAQPKAERAQPHTAKMDIVSRDWIEPLWHPASFTFAIGGQTFRGRYLPVRYKLVEDTYTYYGIFELEQNDAAAIGVMRPS